MNVNFKPREFPNDHKCSQQWCHMEGANANFTNSPADLQKVPYVNIFFHLNQRSFSKRSQNVASIYYFSKLYALIRVHGLVNSVLVTHSFIYYELLFTQCVVHASSCL